MTLEVMTRAKGIKSGKGINNRVYKERLCYFFVTGVNPREIEMQRGNIKYCMKERSK